VGPRANLDALKETKISISCGELYHISSVVQPIA